MSATSDDDDTFTIKYTMPPGDVEHDDALEDPGTSATPPVSTPARQVGTEVETPDDIQFVSPPQDADGLLDADHDEDAPLRFRPLEGVIGPGTTPGPAEHVLVSGVLLSVSAEEPTSVKQAMEEKCWRKAMEEELKSI
jgi:hypothetical protein